MSDEHKFQVDLGGIIDLLSNHLYSGPEVFLRELLQNAVDAITARTQLDPTFQGSVQLEVIKGKSGMPSTLVVDDNGIGLTADEIHQFLSTIGRSSKRESFEREDFIGQFGIGLLSCFVVADEITVITRSARPDQPTSRERHSYSEPDAIAHPADPRPGQPTSREQHSYSEPDVIAHPADPRPGQSAVEWKGRADGTYSLRTLERDFEPGTQVYLQAKPGMEQMFEADFVYDTVKRFGGHLPIPVSVNVGESKRQINEPPPWLRRYRNEKDQRTAYLEYGEEMFGTHFFDAIPLHSLLGEIDGIAFVLPHTASLAAKQTHRVYLKHMLLSEQADDLLPDWAFFVKCVINAQDLRPTASRESFYDDERLAQARENLGQALRDYLVRLAKTDRDRLDELIMLHFLAIKSLAVEDDEFFEMFIDYLPFETSLGTMSLADYLKENPSVKFVPAVDQFRQVAAVAAAQGICLINGGYVHDTRLLEKLRDVFPDRTVERIDVSELTDSFEEVSLEENEAAFDLLKQADHVLRPYGCEAELRNFRPEQLPTLYTISSEAGFRRSIERTKEEVDDAWAGVLDGLAASRGPVVSAQLCLNFRNPLIRRLVELKDVPLVRKVIEMLYVQALLLGHYPLRANELNLMGDGLMGLIELVIDRKGKNN